MQRKNDRNPGREPRSQEGMNLRRMGVAGRVRSWREFMEDESIYEQHIGSSEDNRKVKDYVLGTTCG